MQGQQRGMTLELTSCTLQKATAQMSLSAILLGSWPAQLSRARRGLPQGASTASSGLWCQRRGVHYRQPACSRLHAGAMSSKGMMPHSQATAQRCSISESAHLVMVDSSLLLLHACMPCPKECIAFLTSLQALLRLVPP